MLQAEGNEVNLFPFKGTQLARMAVKQVQIGQPDPLLSLQEEGFMKRPLLSPRTGIEVEGFAGWDPLRIPVEDPF